MFFSKLLLPVLLTCATDASARSRRTTSERFVSTKDGQFTVNGSDFKYLGTTAYWLSTLNSEQDIYDTLANITENGIRVVRTWGFNDVSEVPTDNSTWFQHIGPNGTVSVNTGPTGLQKLDKIVAAAEKLGIYLHVSLTNNWNPLPSNVSNATLSRRDVSLANSSIARNTLSNDYGGMDAYIRSFGADNHDLFYTDEKLVSLFENYTTQVVSRYVNSSAIFAWEIANDPRCNSTLPASNSCNPQTVTRWHARIAKHIKKIDPNHLVASGTHGFFCVDCPKLYPRTSTAPPPAGPSARSQAAAGPAKRKLSPLTRFTLFAEKKRAFKVASDKQTRTTGGPRIRGTWSAPSSRARAELDLGPTYNGAHGVDSEDILNIPDLSFGTFQLFPDQNQYEDPSLAGTNLDAFNQTVEQGISWIRRQGETGRIYGKPVSLTGFGLVTRNNAPFFVPFNSSESAFTNSTLNSTTYGVTDEQRQEAYGKWVNATIDNHVTGAIHYQWGQNNLTTQAGSAIVPDVNSTSQSTNTEQTGIAPNDGYSQPITNEGSQSFFNQASQEIANATSF